MRKIAIIGAGQSGLQLAIALKKANYSVTLYSNHTAKQFLHGKILSSQGMFDSALRVERALGLNLWDDLAPKNTSVTFTLSDPATHSKTLNWQGLTQHFYQSIDQRLKFSRWLDLFESMGGQCAIREIKQKDLEEIARENELTIVATGKGELNGLFQRDDKLSTFDKPQRFLSCLYVKKVMPTENSRGVRVNLIPGVGEYFIMPGLTINGHCEMMLFEGIPEGPFDCWRSITSIEQQFEIAIKLLKKYLPWEAERCQNAEPTDNQACLLGAYTPIVKNPIAKLPSGKLVFGLGDTVVLNDPVAGQGANNACKAASLYLRNIIQHNNKPFDEAWMTLTFNTYWNTIAKWATLWTNMLLLPPPPHVVNLLTAASSHPALANKLANAFDEPDSLFPWINSSEETTHLIQTLNHSGQNASSFSSNAQEVMIC